MRSCPKRTPLPGIRVRVQGAAPMWDHDRSRQAQSVPRYLLQHRHEPHECGVVFAAFKGHDSPLRRPFNPRLVPLRRARDLVGGGRQHRRRGTWAASPLRLRAHDRQSGNRGRHPVTFPDAERIRWAASNASKTANGLRAPQCEQDPPGGLERVERHLVELDGRAAPGVAGPGVHCLVPFAHCLLACEQRHTEHSSRLAIDEQQELRVCKLGWKRPRVKGRAKSLHPCVNVCRVAVEPRHARPHFS